MEAGLGDRYDTFTGVFDIVHIWIIVDRTVNCKILSRGVLR
jgi:hypothetical protein